MYQRLNDLIATSRDLTLSAVDPIAADEVKQFLLEDGQRDIGVGDIDLALKHGLAGLLAYGSAQEEAGLLLGLAYAAAYGVPSWIHRLFSLPPPVPALERTSPESPKE